MADASASMASCWKEVVASWNRFVAPSLEGRTALYSFGSRVHLLRAEPLLEEGDFLGGATDLSRALRTVVEEVNGCEEASAKVFLVTDGEQSVPTALDPLQVASRTRPLPEAAGKRCHVFVVGVGPAFPARGACVGMRARLHNGGGGAPFLFLAEGPPKVAAQMAAVGRWSALCSGGRPVRLSARAASLPGAAASSSFLPGEWVLLEEEEEVGEVALSSRDFGRRRICLEPRPAAPDEVAEIFRQWNSLLLQRQRKGEALPGGVAALKERLLAALARGVRAKGRRAVRDRVARKDLARMEAAFRAEAKGEDALLTETLKGERELAEKVLLTAAAAFGRHEERAFKLRGHTVEAFRRDRQEFLEVLREHREGLPKDAPEDWCRITMASTISDLQDPDFEELLLMGSKFDFLRQFAVTGVPVFVPSGGPAPLNPWALRVESTLDSPFGVLSQTALEGLAEASSSVGKVHGEVLAKEGEAGTRFNAVVPLFDPAHAPAMKPFVRTRLYAACASFAVLKNPHVADFNAHVASLAALWVHLLASYPRRQRPQHVESRLRALKATAALYLDRDDFRRYWEALRGDPRRALATHSSPQEPKGKPLRSETLLKPMFLLYLKKDDGTPVAEIVRLLLTEFAGRCLSGYKSAANAPFTDFFAPGVRGESWLEEYSERALKAFLASVGSLTKEFYTPEEAERGARRFVREFLKREKVPEAALGLDHRKVLKLRNVASAGDVGWAVLRTFSAEVGLLPEEVEGLFGDESLFAYVAHALEHRKSRDRLRAPLPDPSAALSFVRSRVERENSRRLSEAARRHALERVRASWASEHAAAHAGVVAPLTRREVIAAGAVAVDERSFGAVYERYREEVGLLGNACQSRACAHFLLPNRRFNQHLAAGRRRGEGAFPHALHLVAREGWRRGLPDALAAVASGGRSRAGAPLSPDALRGLERGVGDLLRAYREYSPEGRASSSAPPSGGK